jgi:hypothetical protein
LTITTEQQLEGQGTAGTDGLGLTLREAQRVRAREEQAEGGGGGSVQSAAAATRMALEEGTAETTRAIAETEEVLAREKDAVTKELSDVRRTQAKIAADSQHR